MSPLRRRVHGPSCWRKLLLYHCVLGMASRGNLCGVGANQRDEYDGIDSMYTGTIDAIAIRLHVRAGSDMPNRTADQ